MATKHQESEKRLEPGLVRSLDRGLRVLAAVSAASGLRPGEAARAAGVPRPTTYRILETLETLGYVRRSASDNRFRVTLKARALGAGYRDDVRIAQVAGPHLAELGRELIWPVDLSTFEDGAMVIRETTHGTSPLSLDRAMLGARLPMLRTASGRAYLAFSPPEQRRVVLEALRQRNEAEDQPFLLPGALDRMIRQAQASGYATRYAEQTFIPRTSSIAVPVLAGGWVQGCVTIIWVSSALNLDAAVKQFLRPMQAAADAIAALLAEEPAEA